MKREPVIGPGMPVPGAWPTVPLLACAVFVLGPLGLLAPLGLAVIFAIVGLGLAAIALRQRRWPTPPRDLALALILLCGWMVLSLFWTIDLRHGLQQSVRVVLECAGGLLLLDAAARLDPAGRRRILGCLVLGLGLTVILVVVDRLLNGGLMRLVHGAGAQATVTNRGTTMLVLLIWPAALFLSGPIGRIGRWQGGPCWALAAWLAAALGVGLSYTSSAQLAFLVGTLAFGAAWLFGRTASRSAMVLLPLALLAMPLLPALAPIDAASQPSALLKPSARARLVIWQFAEARITERPFLGWGIDAARAIPGGKTAVPLVVDSRGTIVMLERMPLHPHNGPLQIWLELGAVGAVLAAGLVFVLLRRLDAAALPRAWRAVALAAVAGAAIEISVSYGMWQSWWLCGLWFVGFATRVACDDMIVRADPASCVASSLNAGAGARAP